ncbi:hypothetical protein LshimejAT787_1102640 [Lyophyllum shimeji]|uniref:Uncharacterized protein n=1 Tax=Lyophyllum shimeji TaxID=47721 RepID=A0A9P3UP23_LYOSH|nr:hypothetical protein LshimejAT787_1102640 [Lyophyllum shimeji]
MGAKSSHDWKVKLIGLTAESLAWSSIQSHEIKGVVLGCNTAVQPSLHHHESRHSANPHGTQSGLHIYPQANHSHWMIEFPSPKTELTQSRKPPLYSNGVVTVGHLVLISKEKPCLADQSRCNVRSPGDPEGVAR